MSTDFRIPLARLAEVRDRLQAGASAAQLRAAMAAILNDLWRGVAQYPPVSSYPGRVSLVTRKPMGYYERGRGWWYPVMRSDTLGAIGKGAGNVRTPKALRAYTRVAGYRLAGGGTSEALGRKWAMSISTSPQALRGTLYNPASYAVHVQGARDTQQAAYMRKLGWHSVDDVVEAQLADIRATLTQAITAFLADG